MPQNSANHGLPLLEPWPSMTAFDWPQELVRMALEDPVLWVWCFDIDGTLIDLAPSPDAVKVPQSLLRDLTLMAQSQRHRIALVTGRSLQDVRPRFPLPQTVAMAGNHGAEWEWQGTHHHDLRISQALPSLRRLARVFHQLEQEFPGTLVEDKTYSLSLHYRAMDPAQIPRLEKFVQQALAQEPPLTLLSSKKCWDVRVAEGPTKADGIAQLVAPLSEPFRLLIFGDDRTDEDAFRAFPQALNVHIGEGPSVATLSLPGPEAVRNLIATVASNIP